MSIEQRLEQVERQTKRLRMAVVVLAAALCGVVSMAATRWEFSEFDVIRAKSIQVINKSGKSVVSLDAIASDQAGMIRTFSSSGRMLIHIGTTENGGYISVNNKTGEAIADIAADDYGNGEIGAYNRKGKGRVFDSQ
jgi:hypothetical protein